MSQNETRSTVDVAIDAGIATIALNRPEVRNAVNETLRAELVAAIERVAADDAVRAVVITGNGPAFCAGGDIAAMQQNAAAPPGKLGFSGWRRQRRLHHAVAALHGLTKPTIAAVNGPAFGLGCDLAMCCDFVIAAENASFAMNFLYRGLVPDGGGLYFMPRRVGLARAKELIFTGRRVEPQEALAIGMIDRLTSSQTLLADARAWAAELSGGSLTALALTKEILNRTFELGDEEVFALGRQAQAICYTTDEHREAVAAFLAKAPAQSPGA
jgi:enoyl-CoA hydratase/carnithine racemase